MSEDRISHDADQLKRAASPTDASLRSSKRPTHATATDKTHDPVDQAVDHDKAPKSAGRAGQPEDTPSEEDLTCLYSPLNWVCKGYDPLAEYQYFDGVPGTPDQRFLIDLENGSMDG